MANNISYPIWKYRGKTWTSSTTASDHVHMGVDPYWGNATDWNKVVVEAGIWNKVVVEAGNVLAQTDEAWLRQRVEEMLVPI